MDGRLVLPINTIVDQNYCILRLVGAGGFGITYEAEDLSLGTLVAVKEYYPSDFGDRDHTMSVRPKSERHKQTFDWGKASFLEEARTLARFEHPSIVRVTRVFEANSTAYMVMRFEQGLSFEAWLKQLGRPPTQRELDSVTAPLLDALQMMHAANFLHRDIAPDNIIIRPDGTPVLLDFGAARRAVAEMSRSLTGIVKAGYSPHEQYSSDGRLQGPWSDIYALGGTLYRAVVGKPPEEATLRFDEDHMASAQQSAKGKYRREFLAAIDTCLKVRHLERPRSVAQLRPMLLGGPVETKKIETARAPSQPRDRGARRSPVRRWAAIAASLVVIVASAYGGYELRQRNLAETHSVQSAEAESRRLAALPAERQQQEREAADARQRQLEIEEARRRKELADAAGAEARRKAEDAARARRQEEQRIAALEDAKRKDEADRRTAEEDRRREEQRIAAAQEEKRKEEERLRLAALPSDEQRAQFVRRIQEILKKNQCYSGAVNGRSSDAQEAVNKLVDASGRKGKAKPAGIELAKASVGDFETWLKDADTVSGACIPVAAPKPPEKAKVAKIKPERETPERREKAAPPAGQTKKAARDPEACFNRCHAAGGRRGGANSCIRRCGGA